MMDMSMTGGQQPNSGMNDDAMRQIMQMFGIGGGLGTAAGGLFSLFNKPKNPATGANNIVGQIPGKTQPYYQPYMDAGKTALGNLQGENASLLNGTKQNELGAGYKESPGYKYALQQALQAGQNASSAGGMLGTPQHQEGNMDAASGLASRDFGDYMNRQMGLYGQGYTGSQDINHQGYNANNEMANTQANVLGQQGAYNFMGQQGQNQAKQQGLSNIFSGLGMAGGSALGGGNTQIMELLSKLFGGGK